MLNQNQKNPWNSIRLLFSDSPDDPPPEVTLHKTCNLCPLGTVGRRPPCYRPWSLTADASNSHLNHTHRHAAVARLRVSLTHAMAEHMADLAFAAGGAVNSLPIKTPTNSSATTIAAPGSTATTPKVTPVQYHCSYCRFACTWKYDLELHLKQKHGVHKKLWTK